MADLINLKGISDQLQRAAGLNPDKIIDPNPDTLGQGYSGIKPDAITDPSRFYYKLTYGILCFVATLAVLILIYGGLMYLTARDNAEQAERGKKAIIGAIAGIIIIALSFTVYTTLMNILSRSASPGTSSQQIIQEEINKKPW